MPHIFLPFRLKTVIISFFLATAVSSTAQPIIDSLRDELAEATTPSDSITLLYNILDLSPYGEQGRVLDQLYGLAERNGEISVMGDVLRHQSNYFSKNDSMQTLIIERANRIPDENERQTTLLFAKVRKNATLVRSLPENKRQAQLRDYLARHASSSSMDTYARIEYLFYLCAYLRSATDGDLLTKYLKELQELIDNLPARDMSLKSLFYTQAAISYLTNEMYDEAIEANKNLLSIIDELKRQYATKGRTYRNYDRSAYLCYRRLLRCYEALTSEEADNYYNKILALYMSDPSLTSDFNTNQQPTIYYLMAKERYDEVIPILLAQLGNKTISRADRFFLSEALLKASRAVNDSKAELAALRVHDSMLRDRIAAKAAERYKELQIVYEVDNLKAENDQLLVANRNGAAASHTQMMLFVTVCLILMAALVVVLFILNHRSSRLTKNLRRVNDQLVKERDNLERTQADLIDARDKAKSAERVKTEFVNNISHEIRTPLAAIVEYSNLISDCADGDTRPYIKRFADVVSLNSDLVCTLINDILEIPELENDKMSVSVVPTSIKDICLLAVGNVEKRLKPGVDLIFTNADDEDSIVNTDPQRVGQILLNLLSNAAKFTDEGTVTLSYTIDKQTKRATFVVTDTGIGIPRGKEEAIFTRFSKLNSQTQGNGLGLYISRLLVELLEGRLYVDDSYRQGARFVLEIPV